MRAGCQRGSGNGGRDLVGQLAGKAGRRGQNGGEESSAMAAPCFCGQKKKKEIPGVVLQFPKFQGLN